MGEDKSDTRVPRGGRSDEPAGRDGCAGKEPDGRLTVSADRLAFLVDAAQYFAAFAAAAERARRSLLILAWEMDSRLRLYRDGTRRELPERLAPFLDELTRRRPELEVHVLCWDHSVIYSLEREALLGLKMERNTGDRVHFAFDACHPKGASHHQKVVVIDDRVAFLGGVDLAAHRWDTSAHAARDRRRIDPEEELYSPFHDLQIVVGGAAAEALGRLARERWLRATGEVLEPPGVGGDPWPPEVPPVLEGVELALVRTVPEFAEQEAVCETERALLEVVHAARDSIYIETQYLTAARVGEALASRLAEEDGPEVVVVTPRRAQGWLEEATMGALRARLLRRLRRADRRGRLRVVYPVLEDGTEVYVHSKLLVADDRLLYLGSANLANRSMGLDSEVGVLLAAGEHKEVASAIAGLRDRLLAEHLGTTGSEVAGVLAGSGSLTAVLDRLGQRGRRLEPVRATLPSWSDGLLPSRRLLDPRGPAELSDAVEAFAGGGEQTGRRGVAVLRTVLPLVMVLALALAWRYTPLGAHLAPWLDGLASFHDHPLAGPLTVAGFVVGGVLAVPLTALVVASMLTFGGLWGGVWSMAGALASAAVTFGLGRVLGRNALRRLAGGRVERLSRRLAHRGVVTVAVIRNLPLAPYTFINLAAGASPLRFWDFMGGTFLGLIPGLVVLAMFGEAVVEVARRPDVITVALAVAVVVGFAAVSWLMGRRLPDVEEDGDA